MFISQIVKDITGQNYIIRLRNQGVTNPSVKPEKFLNTQLSYQFVCRLKSPFGLWQNIASSNSFFSLQRWQSSNPTLCIEHYAAEVLVQGFVQVYKTEEPHIVNQNRAKNQFKDQSGKNFQFQSASNLLLLNNVDMQSVTTSAQAEQFIAQLSLSETQLETLTRTFDLAPNIDSTTALSDALINGDIVVTRIADTPKPPITTEYVEPSSSAPEPTQSESSRTEQSSTAEEPIRDDAQSTEVLKQSAEEGTPFCEECEKAEQQEQQKANKTASSATPLPVEEQPQKVPVDEQTSADVLENAAESGTPFCEECEKENNEKAA